MRIHISESTRDLLYDCDYEIIERGTITVKARYFLSYGSSVHQDLLMFHFFKLQGKGNMKTYWLERRIQRKDRLELLPENDESTTRTSNSPSINIHSRSTSPEGRCKYLRVKKVDTRGSA